MSELLAFVQLGFHHITDRQAFDHILFLLALAAIYRGRDWRDLLWVITAFTVGRYRPVFAGVFGLVHGPGFANYLTSLFTGSIALPLVAFNAGIELGQLVALGGAGLALAVLDRALGQLRWSARRLPAYRLRVVTLSSIVVLVAARNAAVRAPW